MAAWNRHPLARTLNRYVTAWQRNRPRAIFRRVLEFPPIPSEPHPGSFVVLCEADKLLDGYWCAWSWLRFLHPWLRLRLFVDGEVSDASRAVFARLFPGGEIASMPELLVSLPPPPENLSKLLQHYRYARKLSLILHLQSAGPLLYCDSDVLAFRRPQALLARIEHGSPNAYMTDQNDPSQDPWIVARARALDLPMREELNSGLLWIARDSLDRSLVERLLEGWHPEVYCHFTEQTILAALLPASGAQPLPREEYTLNARGMFFYEGDIPCEELTVRHYVGIVRHRMYSRAYPFLARQAG